MTKKEKETIQRLQSYGLGYVRISQITSISVDTVKSHCRAHPATSVTQIDVENFCRNCGSPIDCSFPVRQRLFCSDKCRMEWWNSHQNRVNRKAWYTFKCCRCGSEFVSYGNNHRKYCSRKCYADARRNNKND